MINNDKIFSTQLTTSVTQVFSSVTNILKMYLLNRFPKGFFHNIWLETANAGVKPTSDKDETAVKIVYPVMSISPKYDLGDLFMGDLSRWHNINDILYANPYEEYNTIINDMENKVRLMTVPDRIKVMYDVKMNFDSTIQQVEALHFYKKCFMGQYFYLNDVPLEVDIPTYIISFIAHANGYKLDTPENRTAFTEFLNKYSYGMILNRINRATGKRVFSYKFHANLLFSVPDKPSIDGVERNELVNGSSTISNQIGIELWIPGYFLLQIDKSKLPVKADVSNIIDLVDTKNSITMTFDVKMDLDKMVNGKLFNQRVRYSTEPNVTVDTTDLKEYVNKDIIDLVEYLREKPEVDISDYIECILYCDNTKLSYDTDYTVNWYKYELVTKYLFPNSMYSLFIYIDQKKLNEALDNGKGDCI